MVEVIEGSALGQLSMALAISVFGFICLMVGYVLGRDHKHLKQTLIRNDKDAREDFFEQMVSAGWIPLKPPSPPLCRMKGCSEPALLPESDLCGKHCEELFRSTAGTVSPKRCIYRVRGGSCDFFAQTGSNYCPMHQPPRAPTVPQPPQQQRGDVAPLMIALMLAVGGILVGAYFTANTATKAIADCDAKGGVLVRSVQGAGVCIDARVLVQSQ